MSSRNLWFLVAIILLTAVSAKLSKDSFAAYIKTIKANEYVGSFEFLSHKRQIAEEAQSLKTGRTAFEAEYVKAPGPPRTNAVLSKNYMLISVGTKATQGFAVHANGDVKPLDVNIKDGKKVTPFGTKNGNTADDIKKFLEILFTRRKKQYTETEIEAGVSVVLMNAVGFAVPGTGGTGEKDPDPLLQIGGVASDGKPIVSDAEMQKFAAKEATITAKFLYKIYEAAKDPAKTGKTAEPDAAAKKAQPVHTMPLFVKARRKPKIELSWAKALANALPPSGAIKYIAEIGGSLTRKILSKTSESSDKKLRELGKGSLKAAKGDKSEYVNTLYAKCEDTVPAAEELARTVIAQMQGVLQDVKKKRTEIELKAKAKAKAAGKTAKAKPMQNSIAVYQTGVMATDYLIELEAAKPPLKRQEGTRNVLKPKTKTVTGTSDVAKDYLEKIKKRKESKEKKLKTEKEARKTELGRLIPSARQAHFNFFSQLDGFDAYEYDDDDAYNNEEHGSYEPDDDKEVSPGDVNGYRYYAEPRAEASQSGYYMDDNIKFAAVVFSAFALMVCCVVSFVCAVCGVIFGFKMQKKSMEKEAAYSNVNVSDNSELI